MRYGADRKRALPGMVIQSVYQAGRLVWWISGLRPAHKRKLKNLTNRMDRAARLANKHAGAV